MAMPLRQSIRLGRYLMKQKLRRNEKFPLLVELEPLFACNLKCAGCGKIEQPASLLKQRMPVEQAVAAIEESGAPMVSIAGGEPLMHPQIDEIVRQLLDRNKIVFLCTNALLLPKHLHKFKPHRNFAWMVHIDGLQERHDESVEQGGRLRRARSTAIKLAQAAGFQVMTNTTFFNTDTPPTSSACSTTSTTRSRSTTCRSRPAYAYEKAPDQEHWLGVEETRELFAKSFADGRRKKWRLNHSPVFLDFLEGKRDLACTAWGIPSYSLLGWQKPCYLLDDGYAKTYKELIEDDRLGRVRPGQGPALRQLHGALRLRADRGHRDHGFAEGVAARGGRRVIAMLDELTCPADLRALPESRPARAGRGDPRAADRDGRAHRRPPRPEPGRGGADASRCTGCSTRRATRSCGTPATRRTCTRCSPAAPAVRLAAPGRRPVRLPAAGRERPRPGRELARLDVTVLPGRPGQGVRAVRPATTGAAVAVVGDGALTGGMCWEALNNIAAAPHRPVVIVLNDNGRSYAPTAGALGAHLAALRAGAGRRRCSSSSAWRTSARSTATTSRRSRPPCARPAIWARPTVVHCVTRKGQGYAAAESDEAEKMHSIGPAGGRPRGRPGPTCSAPRCWRSVRDRPDVVALSAAMLGPTGLQRFADALSRTGRSTSASPSSTRSPRPPGWRWAACIRSSASTRRSSTGRSTR